MEKSKKVLVKDVSIADESEVGRIDVVLAWWQVCTHTDLVRQYNGLQAAHGLIDVSSWGNEQW